MKVLFVSNSPSLTGAPLVLLNFLKWSKKSSNPIDSDILFLKPGNRQNDFAEVCNHLFFLPNEENKFISIFKLIWDRIAIKLKIYVSERNRLLSQIAKKPYQIIYCNTILALRDGIKIRELQKKKFPNQQLKLVCHIHELEITIQHSEPLFDKLKDAVDAWVAVSGLVKTNLEQNHAVSSNLITLVHAFIDQLELNKFPQGKNQKFTIGGSGYAYWRKGSDIFIKVAARFFQCFPEAEAEFVWIGYVNPMDQIVIDTDLKKMGLTEKVKFKGETKNALNEFARLDIFLLTSREDPFPLVSLEVGALGKPIICFENAVGSHEFLTSGGGKIVPYLDIEAMKDAVYQYFENENLRAKEGEKIKELVSPFSTENQSPKIYSVLEKLLNS